MRRFLFAIFLIFSLVCSAFAGKYDIVDFVYTNDIHGHITVEEARFMNPDFPPKVGGLASVKTFIDRVRARAPKEDYTLFVLDAGDIFQGTLIGLYERGTVIPRAMNLVGYDYWTLGNHDFDYGADIPESLATIMNATCVCANLVDSTTGKLVPYVKPWDITERLGIRFGFFGIVTSRTPRMSFPVNVKGFVFTDMVDATKNCVKELRENGADVVIGLFHTGMPYNPDEGWKEVQKIESGEYATSGMDMNTMELIHFVPGVDIAFSGHIHKGYHTPWEDPVTHTVAVQNYSGTASVGYIRFYFDKKTHKIVKYECPEGDCIVTLFPEEFPPDSIVSAFVKEKQSLAEAGMHDTVGVALGDFHKSKALNTTIGNLVTTAMLEATGADVAMVNKGGIRDDIYKGSITRNDVFRVLPFDNRLIVCSITGKKLKQIIEVGLSSFSHGVCLSGAVVWYDPDREEFDRIIRMEINGEPLREDNIYKFVTIDYLMQGNSGMKILTTIPHKNQFFQGMLMRDAMYHYLEVHKEITPDESKRFINMGNQE
ncbi:MAG: hypothetical protein B6D65_01635 [candidate division Zixibacteria bacterium 4484_93]|nr:MAG: hypothetical protein B6D65_01635 [candidate division Zixibacteria bacterium 4484_93]